MIKIFSPIKSRRPWPPILISHLFNKAFLVLGHSFFTPGVFLFRILFSGTTDMTLLLNQNHLSIAQTSSSKLLTQVLNKLTVYLVVSRVYNRLRKCRTAIWAVENEPIKSFGYVCIFT